MDKYLEIWKPVIENFESTYEEICCRTNAPMHDVVDWYPSAHSQITVKLSDGGLYLYELIGNKIIPIRDTNDSHHEERVAIGKDEQAWRNNFSRRLYVKMQRRGINQERLSELSGISCVTLSKYVNGQATPSGFNLERLSNALQCSVLELVSVY